MSLTQSGGSGRHDDANGRRSRRSSSTSKRPSDYHEEKVPLLKSTGSGYGGTGGPNGFANGSVQQHHSVSSNTIHCHDQGGDKAFDAVMARQAKRKIIIASCLCLTFMIAEVVGGILANSLAIATDAAHLLTDFASFMISLFALFMAGRPATKRMSFGWYRAEVMGALISVLLIWVVTGVLVYMAVLRVISMDFEIDATIMLITASVGVAVNLIMGVSLYDSHGHGHSHGGAPSPVTKPLPTEADLETAAADGDDDAAGAGNTHSHVNINVRAAFIHVIGDLFQSIGVTIAATIIYFKPEYKIADPICTFMFSILVLFVTINIMRDTMNVLMEGTPRGIDFMEVRNGLHSIKGVKELHNLRIWSLTMSKPALSVHLAVEDGVDTQDVLHKASYMMKEYFNVYDVTIQIEPYVDEMAACEDCQDPKD